MPVQETSCLWPHRYSKLGKDRPPARLKKTFEFQKGFVWYLYFYNTDIAGWTNLNRREVKHRCSEPSSADSQVNLLWRKMNTIVYFLNLPRQGCPNADWSSRQCHSSWSEILSKFTTLSVFHHLLVVFTWDEKMFLKKLNPPSLS